MGSSGEKDIAASHPCFEPGSEVVNLALVVAVDGPTDGQVFGCKNHLKSISRRVAYLLREGFILLNELTSQDAVRGKQEQKVKLIGC